MLYNPSRAPPGLHKPSSLAMAPLGHLWGLILDFTSQIPASAILVSNPPKSLKFTMHYSIYSSDLSVYDLILLATNLSRDDP